MSNSLLDYTTDMVGVLIDQLDGRHRPPREELYLAICQLLRTQSTCKRGKVGALLVANRRIIATGYNGAPPGMPHCFELGCDVDVNNHAGGCRRAIHAESNVLAFAARHAGGAGGATLYCTHGPCLKCAQLIISAGIERVVFQVPYRLSDGVELLDAANIPIKQVS